MAHQYLTRLLKGALMAAAPSRVVFVSSFGHSYAKYPDGPLAEEDLLSVNDYGPMVAYGRSKVSPKQVIADWLACRSRTSFGTACCLWCCRSGHQRNRVASCCTLVYPSPQIEQQ